MGWINSLPVLCRRCHRDVFRECDCYRECVCGRRYVKTRKAPCRDPIHQLDEQAQRMMKNGFFMVDDVSGKLYKSAASDIKVVYEHLRRDDIWASRKEYNQAMRSGHGA